MRRRIVAAGIEHARAERAGADLGLDHEPLRASCARSRRGRPGAALDERRSGRPARRARRARAGSACGRCRGRSSRGFHSGRGGGDAIDPREERRRRRARSSTSSAGSSGSARPSRRVGSSHASELGRDAGGRERGGERRGVDVDLGQRHAGRDAQLHGRAARACARSSKRSSSCSRPTERRSRSGGVGVVGPSTV